jgi:hypothetical protein
MAALKSTVQPASCPSGWTNPLSELSNRLHQGESKKLLLIKTCT